MTIETKYPEAITKHRRNLCRADLSATPSEPTVQSYMDNWFILSVGGPG